MLFNSLDFAIHFNFNRIFNQINLTTNDFSDLSHLNKYGNRKLAPTLLDSITSAFEIKKEIIKEITEKDTHSKTVRTPQSDNIKGWKLKNMLIKNTNLKFNSTDSISHITRGENLKNSYVRVKGDPAKEGANYGVSLIVKKGDLGSFFGLRISGVYPNRVDAIFDLEEGTVKGVAAGGEFKKENATIKALGNDWYACTLFGEVNTKKIHVIFGPTDKEKEVPKWEGGTKNNNDVYLVNNSIEFKKPYLDNE